MRYFFDEWVLPMLVGAGIMVLFFSMVIGICTAFDAYQCSKYESVTGKQTKYTGLSCYVQHKGDWYSWTEYKNRLVAKGDFSK